MQVAGDPAAFVLGGQPGDLGPRRGQLDVRLDDAEEAVHRERDQQDCQPALAARGERDVPGRHQQGQERRDQRHRHDDRQHPSQMAGDGQHRDVDAEDEGVGSGEEQLGDGQQVGQCVQHGEAARLARPGTGQCDHVAGAERDHQRVADDRGHSVRMLVHAVDRLRAVDEPQAREDVTAPAPAPHPLTIEEVRVDRFEGA